MPAIRKAATKTEETLALLSDPHLYRLFDVFAAHRPTTAKPVDLACFLLDVEARIYGNRQKVEAANRPVETWAAKRKLVRAVSGRDLPALAPDAETVRKWRTRWLPPLKKDEDVSVSEVLVDLLDAATKLGAKRARKLGQFKTGRPRNFADPSPRHNVSMDGTWLTPFSHAKQWRDPSGHEHLLRSRAKSKNTIREQRVVHSMTKDGRKVMGVNHVVGVTRTKYGRVFLGVQRALGGENTAALELTERIIKHTGDGVHSLTYDKGFHGWTIGHLAATHGIQTVLPAKVANSEPTEEEKLDRMLAEQELRVLQFDPEETLRRTGNHPTASTGGAETRGSAKKPKKVKKSTRPNKILIEAVTHQHQAERHDLGRLLAQAEKGIPTGHGLPLGTSHYVSSQKKLVTVRSRHAFYRDFEHLLPEGPCIHPVHVDDGAFWDVAWYDGQWRKTQRVTCLRSNPEKDAATGVNRFFSTHQLICYTTGEILEFDTVYEPLPHRRKATEKEAAARSCEQKALALMQPIARCDERFRRAYGLRNDIESWFSDLKNRLLDDKRAASLDLNHQLLDILYTGMVTNALALRTYRYEH